MSSFSQKSWLLKKPGLCATDLARYVVSGKDEPLEVVVVVFEPFLSGEDGRSQLEKQHLLLGGGNSNMFWGLSGVTKVGESKTHFHQ